MTQSEARPAGAPHRREDARLVTGRGLFAADRRPEGLCHAAFVRSPHARARIAGVDAAAARAVPGAIAVFTAADLAADGVTGIAASVDLKRPDGSKAPAMARPLLARDAVLHQGEPVAMVVASSQAAALDAAERVAVDYQAMPAVTDAGAALAAGAPAVWAEAPDNVAFVWSYGAHERVAAAIAAAPRVARLDYVLTRVSAAPLEPRAVLAAPEPDGRITVHASTQNPFQIRDGLVRLFGISPERLRVMAGDVGGSFGMKAGLAREDALVFWAARRLGRPVRWLCERGEAFLADDQARDVRIKAALALDAEGTFLALDVHYDVNIGAYLSGRSMGPITNVGGVAGVYRTPLIAATVRGVFTNTVPTAPYRGAGRPDATYAIERLIDVAAREAGIDPIALRRRNLIPAEAMPYQTGLIFRYDCGDFRANMDEAARLADVAGFPARREAAASRGRLRGLGVCNPIEVAGGPFNRVLPDNARIVVRAAGTVDLYTGAMSVGQGLETSFAQIVAARLGVPADRVRYHQGDTDDLPAARGSGGSSGLCVSGSAVALAVEQAIEEGRRLAADRLEAALADIAFADGQFAVVGTDRRLALAEVARLAAAARPAAPPSEQGLVGAAQFQPPDVTFPNGCHICEVEVDPETGAVEPIAYVSVEDIGTVINPMLVHGQIHGGVAQGMGQALCERIVHDPDSAQLLTGSFMDYAMPRAADVPPVAIALRAVPTKVNALGAKGVGEAGTVGAIAATMNAICDALAPLGVTHIDMPATPERVWIAIRRARAAGA
jgi:carbon-monoxide dehydrogenase large subunit